MLKSACDRAIPARNMAIDFGSAWRPTLSTSTSEMTTRSGRGAAWETPDRPNRPAMVRTPSVRSSWTPLKRRLWRDGQLVPITAKTFDVLVLLLEHRDAVVSKDELLNRVWPDTVVQENNLARQISSLRRALGQRPDQHDYVVTIPGHGYRFVADVQELAGVPPELQSPSEAQSQRPSERGTESRVPNRSPAGELDADDARPSDFVGQTRLDRGSRARRSSPRAAQLLLATGAVVTLLLRSAPGRVEPRRALQRVTYDEAGLPRDAAWAPDGRWLVYASDRAGNADLWKQRPGDPDPVRLTTSRVQRIGAGVVSRRAIDRVPLRARRRRSVRHRRERRSRTACFQLRPRAALVAGLDAHSFQAFGRTSRFADVLRGGAGWNAGASCPARCARAVPRAAGELAS